MQQIRYGTESGDLQNGDVLPGIRALAKQLGVSVPTIQGAYSELQHEGLLEVRAGSRTVVRINSRRRSLPERVLDARKLVESLISKLRAKGLKNDEIRRVFDAALISD